MARPTKFRHLIEDLADPTTAGQLAGHVLGIEQLHEQRKQIDAQLALAYHSVDEDGFDKKFIRKVVALRAKDTDDRLADEYALSAYEAAVEKGISLARTRREPRSTGYASPKLVETIVQGVQTETGRKALIKALDVMIEAEESNSPATASVMDRDEEQRHSSEQPLSSGKRPEGEPVDPEAGAVSHAGAGESPAAVPLKINGWTEDTCPPDQLIPVRGPNGKAIKMPYCEFWKGLVARHLQAAA